MSELCESCDKEYNCNFELKSWYNESYCLECNKELLKKCMQCDKEIDEDETFCSRYCFDDYRE